MSTDQPGLQVYTANAFDGTAPSVSGGVHQRWAGVALEPELFPDTPNRPAAEAAVLRPGETYEASLEWRFLRWTRRRRLSRSPNGATGTMTG